MLQSTMGVKDVSSFGLWYLDRMCSLSRNAVPGRCHRMTSKRAEDPESCTNSDREVQAVIGTSEAHGTGVALIYCK